MDCINFHVSGCHSVGSRTQCWVSEVPSSWVFGGGPPQSLIILRKPYLRSFWLQWVPLGIHYDFHFSFITFKCAHVPSRFICVWSFATLWSVAHQAPLSMGILQARILEWVAMPSSRGFFQPRDGTCVSYVHTQFLVFLQMTEKVTSLTSQGWSRDLNPALGSNSSPSSITPLCLLGIWIMCSAFGTVFLKMCCPDLAPASECSGMGVQIQIPGHHGDQGTPSFWWSQ